MQLTQTVSMAFKAISGNKVRAFLTMLGVIILSLIHISEPTRP